MSIINLFKKKKKEEKVEEKEEIRNLPMCEYCNEYIEQWEKIKTFDKKKFHSKCFRKFKKEAVKLTLG